MEERSRGLTKSVAALTPVEHETVAAALNTLTQAERIEIKKPEKFSRL